MAYTDNFRRQHDEILAIAGDIARKVQGDAILFEARELRTLLSALAGKVTVHLAMEDKALYPRLVAADDEGSRAIANAFMTEMGGLASAFVAYNQKWTAPAITTDPVGFRQETQSLFAALGRRIERENAKLYPLADRTLGRDRVTPD